MVNVGIIGATGYAGAEIVRLLFAHKYVKIKALGSVSYEGKKISEIYPSLKTLCDDILTSDENVIERCDVVFASVPHGLSEKYARKCFDNGKIFIDLGADFRLHDENDYKTWYGGEYADKELHENAVYALPELFRNDIKGKRIISNPGCYPTSIALGLAPLLKLAMIDEDSIVIDSKSGVTGAGRGLSQNTHYPDCNETFAPYKIAEHRHTPEIEQTLSLLSSKIVKVTFVPHLLPVNRGIVSTIYAKINIQTSIESLIEKYTDFYKDEKFVRIMGKGEIVSLKNVRGSNFCDISLHLDTRTNRVIIVSTIDNLVKGAAGQAIQNMNIVCGFNEDEALMAIPIAF